MHVDIPCDACVLYMQVQVSSLVMRYRYIDFVLAEVTPSNTRTRHCGYKELLCVAKYSDDMASYLIVCCVVARSLAAAVRSRP